jgi:coatomer subunit delta
MKLGKSQKTNQFLESLKAEGEVILEVVQPKLGQSRTDGGVSNFDVQGQLSLQILNQEDGHIQVQVLYSHYLPSSVCCDCWFA